MGCCFQEKTCNISELGKIGPRLLLMTNRKSHARFQLVPKSTTLDDLEQTLCTLFQSKCIFGAHHNNLNEDRPTLSAARCSAMTSFWQCKVYADICGGSLKTDIIRRVVKNSNFQYFFACYFFRSFRDKANIII